MKEGACIKKEIESWKTVTMDQKNVYVHSYYIGTSSRQMFGVLVLCVDDTIMTWIGT